jgi:biotin carboxyl carrier protein
MTTTADARRLRCNGADARQDTRQQMESAEQEARRARNDLLRLDADDLDLRGRRDQDVARQQEAANTARRTLEEVEIRVARTTRIITPIAGQITEIKADAGSFVAPGKPVVSIESAGQGLDLVLYVPPDQGKTIAPNMEDPVPVRCDARVRIAIKRIGTVRAVVIDFRPQFDLRRQPALPTKT